MEIKPKTGFENIKFGMYRKDIINILGEPDRIITDEYDENEQRLDWNYLKIRLTFQLDENDRLTYFTCKNPSLKFNGHKILGVEINKAKKEIFGSLIVDWEIENYELFNTHFNEKIWLTLHEEFGKVSEFELGVPFKNETEYDWPKL